MADTDTGELGPSSLPSFWAEGASERPLMQSDPSSNASQYKILDYPPWEKKSFSRQQTKNRLYTLGFFQERNLNDNFSSRIKAQNTRNSVPPTIRATPFRPIHNRHGKSTNYTTAYCRVHTKMRMKIDSVNFRADVPTWCRPICCGCVYVCVEPKRGKVPPPPNNGARFAHEWPNRTQLLAQLGR